MSYSVKETQPQFYSIWVLGETVMQLHLLGSLYVMTRSFIHWRCFGLTTLAVRLPLYLSILDFGLYVTYSVTGITALMTESLPPAGSCLYIAAAISLIGSMNMALVGGVALTMYLRVCRKVRISLGSYDWKLLVVSIFIPAIITTISVPSFGADIYWCYVKRGTSKVMPTFNLLLFSCVLAVTIFCYTSVIFSISLSKRNLSQNEAMMFQAANLENRITKKILSYILLYMFNWAPAMPYVIGVIIDFNPSWVYFMAMVATSWGGILNAILYAINEGIWPLKNQLRIATRNQLQLQETTMTKSPSESIIP